MDVYWLLEPEVLDPEVLDPPLPVVLPTPTPPIALVAAVATLDAVSFTVLTTLLITLRALASAPPFFEELRFFDDAFFAGAFFAAAFFAGAFFDAFFEAFFAGAFFEEAEAFFDAFFEAFLLAFFEDAFFDAPFFEDEAFFDADFFFDDFLAGVFFADFFLAAMDFSPIQNRVGGEPYLFERKKFVLRGNRVARISM